MVMANQKKRVTSNIPRNLRPLFWSYDFSKLDPAKDQTLIIRQVINYGDLPDWKWIVAAYGILGVRRALRATPTSQLRPPARRLAEVMFGLPSPRYAKRRT